MVDALGNPVGFLLTGGQAHDLAGADHLLPDMKADMLIADKAFDADKRVLDPLAAAGKEAVIPPKANPRVARDYDHDLYKARNLIENFFARLKAAPRHRNPLRQNRPQLPRSYPPRRSRHLAQLRTRPSSVTDPRVRAYRVRRPIAAKTYGKKREHG